jgi:chemotaxis signal transduction protein
MSSANQLAEIPQTSSMARYLIFTLGNDFYAINTENVIEILENFSFTPVPTNVEWLLGVGNFHGEAIPIIDVKIFQQNGSSPEVKKVIVLQSLERKNFEMAILVDSICEIKSVENFNPVKKSSFLVAESFYKEKRLYLVDVEMLIDQILNKVR